jgi:hypothetical protein
MRKPTFGFELQPIDCGFNEIDLYDLSFQRFQCPGKIIMQSCVDLTRSDRHLVKAEIGILQESIGCAIQRKSRLLLNALQFDRNP